MVKLTDQEKEKYRKIVGDFMTHSYGMFKAKDADYGSSFADLFCEFGMLSLLIRLSDKLSRLKALQNKDPEVLNESVADTLIDLGMYSFMGVALLHMLNEKAKESQNEQNPAEGEARG